MLASVLRIRPNGKEFRQFRCSPSLKLLRILFCDSHPLIGPCFPPANWSFRGPPDVNFYASWSLCRNDARSPAPGFVKRQAKVHRTRARSDCVVLERPAWPSTAHFRWPVHLVYGQQHVAVGKRSGLAARFWSSENRKEHNENRLLRESGVLGFEKRGWEPSSLWDVKKDTFEASETSGKVLIFCLNDAERSMKQTRIQQKCRDEKRVLNTGIPTPTRGLACVGNRVHFVFALACAEGNLPSF